MTYYFVLWLSWACPLGWFSGMVPDAARPLLCAPGVEVERFDPAQLERARGRVRAMGPASKLYRCDGRRCRELKVTWRTEAEFSD